MASWLWGTSAADEPIDRATSELLPAGTEDIALNLEICDQIRAKTIPPKDAIRALKRRLNHKNPNVQLLTLGLTDICVKNGGDHFLVEVASRDFMDNLVSILKMPGLNMDVKNKILRLVQNWAAAFESRPSLRYVPDVYRDLQHEGFNFPPKDPAATSSAMVDTKTAPEWIDSDVCLRCRTAFTFTNRKHHCRNCGQVFDQQCSSKTLPLPHFGITQEVRVCDNCFNKLTRQRKSHSVDVKSPKRQHRAPREFNDADLQRAIQLSLQEVGAATGHARPGYVPYQPSEPPLVDRSTHPTAAAEEEDDPDLRAAIEASLREANAPRASAPVGLETPRQEHAPFAPGHAQSYPPSSTPLPAVPAIPTYDLEPLESDAILTFNQTVEQVQALNRPDVARYPAVNELYNKASSLSPKLAMSMDDAGRKEQLLEDMHNKLSQAVKLYDQLLTQQVAQPARRAQAPYAPSPYQQAAPTGYNSAYNQWAPAQAQPPAHAYAQPYQAQPSSPPTMHVPFAPQRQYSLATAPEQVSSPMAYQAPPAPVSIAPATALQSPALAPVPVSFAPPAEQQPIAAPPPPAAVAVASPPPPQQVYAPPPAQPAYQQPAYQQPVPAQPPVSQTPVPYPPQAQQQAPQQPQQAPQHFTPTTALPQFPVAPSLPPTAFSLNTASPIPTGFEQPERKEVLLIDL